MAGTRASAAWYRDSPEWLRITPVADAERIITGLSQQRDPDARPPAASPAALAAVSFPAPVSQATAAYPVQHGDGQPPGPAGISAPCGTDPDTPSAAGGYACPRHQLNTNI